jgi:short-subunit dehydrogenase
MRPRVLITGASGGIGAELARLFAEDDYELLLAARNLDALDALAEELRAGRDVPVRTMRSDLSAPGAAERLWREAAGTDGTVDVLVNNAGAGVYGPFAEQDAEAVSRMLELNVVALTALTRLALPGMVRRGTGRILNVASVVGYQPGGPRMAAYYASKSYVLAFSRGLARELEGTGITVTALSPGAMRTGFEARAGMPSTRVFRWFGNSVPAAVAKAGYRGLQRGRATVIPGWTTKLLAFAGELPPRRIALAVNRFLLETGRG